MTTLLHMISTDDETESKTGRVAWFNSFKGFGFISLDDGSGDVYVHQSNIVMDGFRKLKEGERVDFKVGKDTSERGKGKLYAYDVTQLGSTDHNDSDEDAAKEEERTASSAAEASVHEETTDEEEEVSSAADESAQEAEESAAVPIDITIPYDAAAQLAYEASDKSLTYDAFTTKYDADAIAMVTSKKAAKDEEAAAKAAEAAEAKKAEENAAAEDMPAKLEATTIEPKKDYAAMDLGEQAFNILLDLGAVSLTPDPDSPDYDSSKDDEIASENVKID